MTSHIQLLHVVNFLVTILVEANVNLLQADSIVETLLVDDILDVVGLASLATCCGEVPLAADDVDGIPTLSNGLLPQSDVLSQTVVVLLQFLEALSLLLVEFRIVIESS